MRDSCYNCKYAQRKRRADITIGDFPGIGSRDNYFGERKEISSILISSLKGLELIHELSREGYLFIEEKTKINFRKGSQTEAIRKTLAAIEKDKKHFLWDAKMRFGKTLTALEIARQKKL